MARTTLFVDPLMFECPSDWTDIEYIKQFMDENSSRTLKRTERRILRVTAYFIWMAWYHERCKKEENYDVATYTYRCREKWNELTYNEQRSWARPARRWFLEIVKDVRPAQLATTPVFTYRAEVSKANGNVMFMYKK